MTKGSRGDAFGRDKYARVLRVPGVLSLYAQQRDHRGFGPSSYLVLDWAALALVAIERAETA